MKRTLAETREESYEEGRVEGIEDGVISTLICLVKDGILTLTDAAARTDMSISEFEYKAGLS